MDTTKKDRFTPGPWDAGCAYFAPAGPPLDEDRDVRAVMSSRPDQDVAYLLNTLDPEEVRANARLISAAPELLHTLRLARGVVADDRPWSDLVKLIDRVIAKATDPTPYVNEEPAESTA